MEYEERNEKELLPAGYSFFDNLSRYDLERLKEIIGRLLAEMLEKTGASGEV